MKVTLHTFEVSPHVANEMFFEAGLDGVSVGYPTNLMNMIEVVNRNTSTERARLIVNHLTNAMRDHKAFLESHGIPLTTLPTKR